MLWIRSANESTTFSYNENGSPVKQSRAGSDIFTDYDSESRPTDIIAKDANGNLIKRYYYSYDKEGNITAETGSVINNYIYDNLERLKTWNDGGATTSYSYDKVGNILSVTGGSTASYEYRDDNSILTRNGVTFSYDNDGNPTNDGTWNYSYDAEGRLTQATKTGTTASYSYDHLGRRISKTVNGTTTKYKYDGWNVTREMNSDESSTLAEYSYDQAGKPLSMRRGGNTYYYTYNARGDITAVVDSNGAVTNSYSYNPWGKHLTSTESVENPYRYASYRYDSETGLYYLQNRYYSPDMMRFISRDLIKDQIGDPGSSNYYSYADSNPVNNIDPEGTYFYKLYVGFGSYIKFWIGRIRHELIAKVWGKITYGGALIFPSLYYAAGYVAKNILGSMGKWGLKWVVKKGVSKAASKTLSRIQTRIENAVKKRFKSPWKKLFRFRFRFVIEKAAW